MTCERCGQENCGLCELPVGRQRALRLWDVLGRVYGLLSELSSNWWFWFWP